MPQERKENRPGESRSIRCAQFEAGWFGDECIWTPVAWVATNQSNHFIKKNRSGKENKYRDSSLALRMTFGGLNVPSATKETLASAFRLVQLLGSYRYIRMGKR